MEVKSQYICTYCKYTWEEMRENKCKNMPTVFPCKNCGKYEVERVKTLEIIPDKDWSQVKDFF